MPGETVFEFAIPAEPLLNSRTCCYLADFMRQARDLIGNWRLIFRYDEQTNTASDVDLMD